eukprot:Polyplicarium_translucidae@DN3292_c0_g3_i1.p1
MMDADGATEMSDLHRLERKLLLAQMRERVLGRSNVKPAHGADVPPSPMPADDSILPGRILPDVDAFRRGAPRSVSQRGSHAMPMWNVTSMTQRSDSQTGTGIPASQKEKDSQRDIAIQSPFQIVVGSRQHLINTDVVAARSWHRNLLMRGFHVLVCFVCGSEVQDTQCGFKLFSRPAARRIFPFVHLSHWAFDVEVIFIAKLVGLRVEEVAVNWKEVAGSKLNPLKAGGLTPHHTHTVMPPCIAPQPPQRSRWHETWCSSKCCTRWGYGRLTVEAVNFVLLDWDMPPTSRQEAELEGLLCIFAADGEL